MCKQQGKETYTQVNKEKEPTEIDAGWTQPLDLSDKNKKLLLRSKNVKLLNTCLDSEFLDLTPTAKATKTKVSKWDYLKLKNFCRAKEIINKMKRQPMEWDKTFANHVLDKGLISKI